jgi:HAMP domain-containing protein
VSDVVAGAAIGAGTAWWVVRWREGRVRRRTAAGAAPAAGESSGTGA